MHMRAMRVRISLFISLTLTLSFNNTKRYICFCSIFWITTLKVIIDILTSVKTCMRLVKHGLILLPWVNSHWLMIVHIRGSRCLCWFWRIFSPMNYATHVVAYVATISESWTKRNFTICRCCQIAFLFGCLQLTWSRRILYISLTCILILTAANHCRC